MKKSIIKKLIIKKLTKKGLILIEKIEKSKEQLEKIYNQNVCKFCGTFQISEKYCNFCLEKI